MRTTARTGLPPRKPQPRTVSPCDSRVIATTKRRSKVSTSGAETRGREKRGGPHNMHHYCLSTKIETVQLLLSSVRSDEEEGRKAASRRTSASRHPAPDILIFGGRKMIILPILWVTHFIILCLQNMETAHLHPEVIMTRTPPPPTALIDGWKFSRGTQI